MRFLTIICVLQSLVAIGQSFEGEIVYKIEIRNAFPESLADTTFKMMYQGSKPSNQFHYYKEEYFKTISEGPSGRMISVFDPTTKRVYSYTEGTDVGVYTEANENLKTDSIHEINLEEIISGVECFAFALGNEISQTVNYYPKKYRTDILRLKKERDFQRKIQRLGAIPMKIEIRGGGAPHFVVMTAIQITPKILPIDFFQIPKFKQVMKMKFP